MSPVSAGATPAPSEAEQMRVRGARLHSTRDRNAPRHLAAPARARIAPASDTVEAQQRFLAYAAHELRGSITLQRTLADVALADPSADTASLRKMGERVIAACERQARLLEALLALAASKRERLRREPVDLAAIASDVLRANGHPGLRRTSTLEPARTTGDPQLLEHLIANLIGNAVHHNVPRGRLDIATYTAAGRASFVITNTGPVIAACELNRLFQPFQRLSALEGPTASRDGVGLGLAIVQAIASSHDATITAGPRPGGGLEIDVAFPALD